MSNVYIKLVGKPEGKRRLWRPTRQCEDFINVCLKHIELEDVDWIHPSGSGTRL